MKIQFLLFSEGSSHKLLGLNVVKGLKSLGIRTEFFWPKTKIGSLLDNPDYVFCLKPSENDDLVKFFKKKGSKLCLVVNDQKISKERQIVYDFAVASSIESLSTYDLDTFLVKEEFDYCEQKQHNSSFKIVTTGYKENLVNHLPEVLKQLEGLDITIISNFEESYELPKIFYKFKMKNILVPSIFNCDYDKILIKQFSEYDVGFVTQYKFCGRSSNRLKELLYAGLPVVTNFENNYEKIWFNKYKVILRQVSEDWKQKILELNDVCIRQDISDENFDVIKNNYGYESSAKSFLRAISLFEKSKARRFLI